MRITGADISMAASSQRIQFQQQTATVKMWHEKPQEDRAVAAAPKRTRAEQEGEVGETRRRLWSSDPLLARYIDLLERMFGVKVAILDPDDLSANGAGEVVAGMSDSERPSLAITVDLERTRYEAESVKFQAAGRVTTSDGRTIDLQMQSKISREFLEHSEQHFAYGAAVRKDPLVLNLDGLPATLTDAQIEFDLDADGQVDRFHVLGDGSAYLTWDRNGDGTVKDGTELFGPTSGNGYTELAAHDYDGNGWIDEGDAIYAQLGLWRPEPPGPRTTSSLSAAQIGAIYLGHVATPFTITPGSSEDARGEVRATGLFLREDGTAGTVQQLDLMA